MQKKNIFPLLSFYFSFQLLRVWYQVKCANAAQFAAFHTHCTCQFSVYSVDRDHATSMQRKSTEQKALHSEGVYTEKSYDVANSWKKLPEIIRIFSWTTIEPSWKKVLMTFSCNFSNLLYDFYSLIISLSSVSYYFIEKKKKKKKMFTLIIFPCPEHRESFGWKKYQIQHR